MIGQIFKFTFHLPRSPRTMGKHLESTWASQIRLGCNVEIRVKWKYSLPTRYGEECTCHIRAEIRFHLILYCFDQKVVVSSNFAQRIHTTIQSLIHNTCRNPKTFTLWWRQWNFLLPLAKVHRWENSVPVYFEQSFPDVKDTITWVTNIWPVWREHSLPQFIIQPELAKWAPPPIRARWLIPVYGCTA